MIGNRHVPGKHEQLSAYRPNRDGQGETKLATSLTIGMETILEMRFPGSMRAIIQRIWALKCSVIFLGVFVFWGKPLLTQTLVDHGGKHMPHPKVVNLYWDDN